MPNATKETDYLYLALCKWASGKGVKRILTTDLHSLKPQVTILLTIEFV